MNYIWEVTNRRFLLYLSQALAVERQNPPLQSREPHLTIIG